MLAAAAADGAARLCQPATGSTVFAGQPCDAHMLGAGLARIGETVVPIVAMCGVKRRVYVRPSEYTQQDRNRNKAKNSAAKQRFLIREDGTIWRNQAGAFRHLKSKKTPAHLKRLSRMVRVHDKFYKRMLQVLHYRPPSPKASDYIMRKFNEARLKDHLWTSDRGVGTALFT